MLTLQELPWKKCLCVFLIHLLHIFHDEELISTEGGTDFNPHILSVTQDKKKINRTIIDCLEDLTYENGAIVIEEKGIRKLE